MISYDESILKREYFPFYLQQYEGYDPAAKAICSDKVKVKYDWISPILTEHLFHATPRNKKAKIEIKTTDRFGNVYTATVSN